MNNDIAVRQDFDLPALHNDMAAAYAEEMEGLSFSYDRAKIPSGGGLTFEIGEDDDIDVTKEIVGIIVDHHPVNAYWGSVYGGGNQPPDCSSMDGKQGTIYGDCKTCQYNQWGSDVATGGKLCKNQHRIYILREGASLPILLTLPPTSLKAFGSYLSKRILERSKLPRHVLTKIGLKKVANNAGIAYSEVTFTRGDDLPDDLRPEMDAYCASLKTMTRALSVADEYAASDEDQPF